MGYSRAGFDPYGIDNKPQKHYPFPFLCMDALEALDRLIKGEGLTFSNGETLYLRDFSAIHASPPCQGYYYATKDDSKWVSYSRGKQTPKLINEIRERLKSTNKPYVIENVRGASKELNGQILLCGTMFGLPITRHRIFDCSVFFFLPSHNHNNISIKYANEHGLNYRDMSVTGKGRNSGCLDTWKTIMGIDWKISQSEIVEAIPPAYTKFIGKYLMQESLKIKDLTGELT
jgi:DNA (cytosine-5)-methyltransferase 1